MVANIIDKIDRENTGAREIPPFRVGDLVEVHVKIREGDKERVQVFKGTVIARDGGGATETFTVRRVSYGVGVERVFPVYSPYVEKIVIERSSHVRRAKLYFLRQRIGKKARLRTRNRV